MNEISFEKMFDKPSDELKDIIPANLTLPPSEGEKEAPFIGRVPMPKGSDFPEKFSNFCFHSLYIKDEIVKAMVKIRTECEKACTTLRVFHTTPSPKVLRVEEFKQLQIAS